jgi:hypothetical protein
LGPPGFRRCFQAIALIATHSLLASGALASGALAPRDNPGAGFAAGTAASSRYPAWRAAAAQALSAHEDAGSLATAAALRYLLPPRYKADSAAIRAAAVDLAARASDLDPDNAAIGWLRLQLCAGTAGCDIRDPATTMRWVDADNSAVWMATLAVAQRDKDSEEVSRILQEMAQGSRFEVYRNRTVVLLFDTLKHAEAELPAGYVPSDLSRLSEVMAVAGAEIVPPFTPLLAACRESYGERRENCLKLAKLMQRADTVSAQMAGLTIEKRLSPPDSKDARAVAERRRELEWRVTAASEYDAPALPWLTNALARDRVREMRNLAREEDVDIAILRRHKIALEPPESSQ